MSPVLDLAPEILHQIFIDVQPTDLGSLSMTCQYLNQVIRNDERLWRHHYLSHFVIHHFRCWDSSYIDRFSRILLSKTVQLYGWPEQLVSSRPKRF